MTGTIRIDRADGATRITLDRPDRANALTASMLVALRDAVRGASGCVLVLTGAGRVFSAGADLTEAAAGLTASPLWEEVSGAVADFPGLSIAALNGTCAGGALGMALACDLRLAVPGAAYFYPVVKLGFLPQPSDAARLTALLGPARAALVLLAGARIEADEALRIGLVDRVGADLAALVREVTEAALAADPAHVAAVKGMVR